MKLMNTVYKLAAALAIGACLVVSGCGGGGGSSEPQTVVDSTSQASDPVQAPVPVLDPVLEPVPAPVSDPVSTPAPIPEKIALWGDSLTAGGYANELATLLPSREIYMGGVGAQTSTQIAARQGSVVPLFSVTDNSIPATGPVAITARSITPLTSQGFQTLTGTIGGVAGTLNRLSDDSYTFTRILDGAPVAINTNSAFTVDTFGRDLWINVFWMGRNNAYLPLAVKADIAGAIDFLKATPKRFIVLSILNASSEIKGTSAHTGITKLNSDLATTYPDNYIDMRAYLVSQYDPLLAQDVIDFQNDVVPTSMRRDAIHLNQHGNSLVAKKVFEFITGRGW